MILTIIILSASNLLLLIALFSLSSDNKGLTKELYEIKEKQIFNEINHELSKSKKRKKSSVRH